MPSKRFPKRDMEFGVYADNAVSHLMNNAVRLLISPANISRLAAVKADWDNWFPKNRDPAQRTKVVTVHKNEIRKNLEGLLRSIYRDIPGSVLAVEDRQTLNFPLSGERASQRSTITDIPMAGMTALAGARISFMVRRETDANRPSLHPKADGIEVAFSVGGNPPAAAARCGRNFISKKSRFFLQLDYEDRGKPFYCFVRWVNLTDLAKSSPWTEMMSLVVTG
jgi:hypothetical protein